MDSKPAKSQRKLPKQGRSKALVEAIIEATTRILPKLGSRNITTQKIADFAGVSIGSLYQYFPNKESVLGAMMDVAMKSETAKANKTIHEISGKSMRESTDTMVDFAINTFLKEKERTREIYMLAPELGRLSSLLKLRQSVVEKLAEEMKRHHPNKEQSDYIRVSFIAVNSVMGVITTMLYDENQTYSISELSIELKSMLNSYFESRIKL